MIVVAPNQQVAELRHCEESVVSDGFLDLVEANGDAHSPTAFKAAAVRRAFSAHSRL